VHPREAFRTAVRKAAAGVVFVHNHPGGSPEPSPEDRALTARLCRAGQVLGIPVLDHVIIAEQAYYSFADRRELG
jgi:DNA repair protein RadC